ncbi:MAG: serine hydrolase [Thermoguttaceae bacterium]|nr:serine hydrolase [Thermoguttaceae bacterium]
MTLRNVLLTAATLLLSTVGAYAQNLDANGALPRATPESVGVPSDALVSLIQRLDREIDRVDSVMVLRDGKVIAEAWRAPNAPEKPHAMYSLSKSFCSTAIGFAIDEGKMSLDQKIVDFFPDDVPADASENLKKIDIESLLSMSCGHEKEAPI